MSANSILEQLITLSLDVGREDRGLAILGEGNTSAAVGDGTHARFIPRALNFGPEFHADHVPAVDGIDLETPPFIAPGAGNAHGADEWASLKNLKTAFVLYALGLVRLDQYLQ